jgi:hypothetical protein
MQRKTQRKVAGGKGPAGAATSEMGVRPGNDPRATLSHHVDIDWWKKVM